MYKDMRRALIELGYSFFLHATTNSISYIRYTVSIASITPDRMYIFTTTPDPKKKQ